ncbi:hypothetical protein LJ737_24915 [Hymenobacter sp. 15J16-1T3B]|uniref:hypothetical protein n=1 Tax=Hymenobacter sp. 15J16-1T3B TaxID=2886941 RepID=UPI001D1050B1|nr:hypothetical protein [Hymenobacter sp. 15J16-1T3B]MCC3160502.1 hypothetical protein [Hymenobacter sp. 15J16-1T3B]
MPRPDGNTRALLGGLLLALLVVGMCFTAYPPGSAEYDETNGHIHAVVGYHPVSKIRTAGYVIWHVLRLALLPLLIYGLARRQQRRTDRRVRVAWLLWLLWPLLLAGWLFVVDWYPPANID